MAIWTNQQVVLDSTPHGELRRSDFRLEEIAVPVPGEGEILLETIYLSVDPYMRFWMRPEKSYNDQIKPGDLMVGATVSRVRRSRHQEWQEGEWVLAFSGWRRFALSDGKGLRRLNPDAAPPSTALGVLGMTGFTAYAGLRNIGRPQAGETVVVAAASGAVGSVVGQIARLRGARAVGITTGERKLAYVKDELGFDAVVDHQAPDFAERLAQSLPKGTDVYFENVGGKIWNAVFPLLNTHARIPVVGLISQYESRSGETERSDRLPNMMAQIMGKSLTLRGFIQTEFAADQMPDFLSEATEWLATGQLRYRKHFVDGLEDAPDALIALMQGSNLGKMVVRVAES